MSSLPKAPPFYRPSQNGLAVQPRLANIFRLETRPSPPVYRPQTGHETTQLKQLNSFKLENRPAPPVYRPQQGGVSATQTKSPLSSHSLQPQSQYELSPPVWMGNGRQQIRVNAKGSPMPVGSVDVRFSEPGKAFISDLEVAQAHRQHGLGSMLVKAALDSARRQGSMATELEANPSAGSISRQALVSMYQKLGFRNSGFSRRGNSRMVIQGKGAFSRPMPPPTYKPFINGQAQQLNLASGFRVGPTNTKSRVPAGRNAGFPNSRFAIPMPYVQRSSTRGRQLASALQNIRFRDNSSGGNLIDLEEERTSQPLLPPPPTVARTSTSSSATANLMDLSESVLPISSNQSSTTISNSNDLDSIFGFPTQLPPKTKDADRKEVRKRLVEIAGEIKSKINIANQIIGIEAQQKWAETGIMRNNISKSYAMGTHEWQMMLGEQILKFGWGACTDIAAATYYRIVTDGAIFKHGYKVQIFWASGQIQTGGHAYVVVSKGEYKTFEQVPDDAWVVDVWDMSTKDNKTKAVRKKSREFNVFQGLGKLKCTYPPA